MFRGQLLLAPFLFVGTLVLAAEWNPENAAHYSRKTGGSVLIINRQGKTACEFYEEGCHLRTPWPVFSITKSLTALACLSLRDLSPDELLSKETGFPSLTLRHLLSQTSGISPGYEKLYKKNIADVRKVAASLPEEFPPGERFFYGPSHYELIGRLLDNGSGTGTDNARTTLTAFLRRLGIQPAGWRTDRQGKIFLSAGVLLTPEDLLKLGRFILDRGRVFGFWPVLPKERFDMAFVGSAANPAYGLGFWLNRSAGHATSRDVEEAIRSSLSREEWSRTSLSNSAPRDLICMAGSGGQRVYVIPSLRTVIVRLGHPSGFKDPEFLDALFSSRKG